MKSDSTVALKFLLFLFALLCFVTIITRLIKKENNSVSANLYDRLSSLWAITAILIVSFITGRVGTIVIFSLISFCALREFLSAINSRRSDYYALVVTYYFILPFQYLLVFFKSDDIFSLFIPIFCFLALPIVTTATSQDTKNFFSRTSKLQWSVMLTIFCISHVPALLNLNIPAYHDNFGLIIFLVVIILFSDFMQIVFGKLFGKHLIAPQLSKAKTIEGFIGGIISASILAAFFSPLTPFTPWEAILIGLVIAITGFLGSLVMSAIKHDSQIKKWGDFRLGRGGMIDRMDSISFAAPLYFYLIKFFWV